MNIDEILLLKYPSQCAQGKIKFIEENDGKGIVISLWDMPIPQPSLSEILSFEPDSLLIKELNSIKEIRKYNLKTELPSSEELIVTLWEFIVSGDRKKLDEIEQQRQAIFNKYPE